MSPAVGRAGMSGMNGARANSPPSFAGSGGNAKDSFLNYFFGKDGALPPSNGLPGGHMSSSHLAAGSRHVSANIEPSFAGSIRRGDTKLPERPMSSHISIPGEYDSEDADNGYVSLSLFSSRSIANIYTAASRRRPSAHRAGSSRNRTDPSSDIIILQHCTRDHCRPSPQSSHALARQPLQGRCPKQTGQRVVQGGPVQRTLVRGRCHQERTRKVREVALYLQGGCQDYRRGFVRIWRFV
jgi:hypothetical protein